MKTAPAVTVILSLVFELFLFGCANKSTVNTQPDDQPSNIVLSVPGQPDAGNQNDELARIYAGAIGDYIRLVNKDYRLTFDTLFFGKHVFGQPDDFPDIELPAIIENTNIRLITPAQGAQIQSERKSSFYINLIGWVNADDADFTFVTFSNGFAHQFDCLIRYRYDSEKKDFVIESSQFQNYQYNKK